MSDHSITSLIEKLEGAEVGSAALDREIARLFGWHRVEPRHARNKHGGWIAPEDFIGTYSDGSPKLDGLHGTTIHRDPYRFTTSLDAALALAERALPKLTRMEIKTYAQGEFHHCTIETDDDEFDANNCRTPALALCAAIVKATGDPDAQ